MPTFKIVKEFSHINDREMYKLKRRVEYFVGEEICYSWITVLMCDSREQCMGKMRDVLDLYDKISLI